MIDLLNAINITPDNTAINKRFLDEVRRQTLRQVKLACILSITIYLIFGILDWIVYPNLYKTFWLFRIINTFITSLILLLTYTSIGKNHPYPLGMLAALSICTFNSFMVGLSGGHESGYYVGIIVVSLATLMLFPWGPKEFGILCLLIHAIYLTITYIFSNDINWPMFINNNFFMISTYIILITTSYFSRRVQFQSFKARSELEEAKQKLEISYDNLQKARDEKRAYIEKIASTLAHEIRNPLQPIRTYLEVLQDNADNPDFPKEMAEAVNPYLDRILALVNQLMHLGKMDKPISSVIHPHLPLDDAIKILEPKLKSHQINVIKSYAHDSLTINADRNQLAQVYFNLVKNAIEAMSKGGTLTLETSLITEDGNKYCRVSVQDSGSGMNHETLSNLFKPFFTTKREKGTGLGLSVSKQIVEAHGGKIHAESDVGKGTNLLLTFHQN